MALPLFKPDSGLALTWIGRMSILLDAIEEQLAQNDLVHGPVFFSCWTWSLAAALGNCDTFVCQLVENQLYIYVEIFRNQFFEYM